MRILHFSSAKTWRGGEQQIAYLIEELKALGIEQTVLCVEDSKLQVFCETQNIDYHSYKKVVTISPGPGLRLKKIIQTQNIDLVHLHDAHAHTFACIGASIFGIPTPYILSRRVDFPIKKSFLSRWKYNHPSIKAIICVSNFIKKIIKPDIKDSSKIEVIHSGIDPSRFHFKKNNKLRKEYGIAANIPLIVNVAALAPHKDLYTFIDTAALILQQHPKAMFLLIGGDGGEEQGIRAYIKQKSLSNSIILCGFRNDIPEILPGADLFLFTSETEGLGTSLLDTLACQVPIVATRAGGIPEIIIHEKSGLLADVKDAPGLAHQVLRLLKEEDLRAKVISGGLQKLEGFKKAQTAGQTLEIYRDIIS